MPWGNILFVFKNGQLEKEKAMPHFLYIPPQVVENEELILFWEKAVLADDMVRPILS